MQDTLGQWFVKRVGEKARDVRMNFPYLRVWTSLDELPRGVGVERLEQLNSTGFYSYVQLQRLPHDW